MKASIEKFIQALKKGLHNAPQDALLEARSHIRKTSLSGGRIYVLGNGTSFGLAGIFVSDLNKVIGQMAFRIPSTTEELTAWANDESFESAYARALGQFLRSEDLVWCISCSGNSQNLLAAAQLARQHSVPVIALTGNRECSLARFASVHIPTPAFSNECIESIHMGVLKSIIVSLKEFPLS